ncbi:MAG: lipocalin-like domain-containing protein [Kofleriaceae bacterium]|nr:lipocalin-like domain-containing protein [Kofleriaceae bacterium]
MSASSTSVLGTWVLESFRVRLPVGWWPWGLHSRGTLTYRPDGTMEARIIARGAPWFPAPSRLFQDVLWYEGPYELRGDVVRHRVARASYAPWVGSVLERRVRHLDASELVLDAENDGRRSRLIWRRLPEHA